MTFTKSASKIDHHLIRLQTARDTMFIDTTASIWGTAFTNKSCHKAMFDITASVGQNIFPPTNISCLCNVEKNILDIQFL